MRKVFQAELSQVSEELVQISSLVGQAIVRARESLFGPDLELAQEVISADARIDFLQNDLDERAIDILALQGPVASDLRVIVGSLRMSASLERMGDLARHIAQLARLRFPHLVIPERMQATFEEMAELDIQISSDLTQLLQERDLDLVTSIASANNRIDQLHSGVFKTVADKDWTESPATTVDVTLASRYFERFGDHGVSVARKVSYLVTGQWQPETFS